MGDFYEPWFEEGVIPEECFLKPGDEPQIFYSNDFDTDIYSLRSNYFIILGDATYNGPSDSSLEKHILSLCREKRAVAALYGYQYTDTRSGIYSSGRYITSYSIPRYDYEIYLFVPMPKSLVLEKARIGFEYRSLNASDRLNVKRNVGVYVSLVYVESPAFYANISPGDVITEVNGISISNEEQLKSIIKNLKSSDTLNITLYRGGLPFTASLTPLY